MNALSSERHVTIATLARSFEHAFNERNAGALGALFTTDAEFVNLFGMRFRGREDIVAKHVAQFSSALHGTRLRMELGPAEITGRSIAPGVILSHVGWLRERLPDAGPDALPPGKGVLTFVVEERDGEWLFSAATNVQCATPPARVPTPAG